MRDIWAMRFALHSIFLYLPNPKSMQKRTLLDGPKFQITIKRLCHQLIENHTDFSNTVLIGIQPRGSYFADRVQQELSTILPASKIRKGNLDITFFRDDFRRKDGLVSASSNTIDFIIEGKNVVLIDDVLWTGRTIRAALDALLAFGRPAKVELMVLIDRRFSRHVPVEADYTGQQVDSVDSQLVRVTWKEIDGEDKVILLSDRNK
jgi:pyrimidine operon attenuation protein/uracil phosphoribosyltransferase